MVPVPRRSIRRVSIPSSIDGSASPSMAKSMKSAWPARLNRSRSGPSTGGRPRDLDRLGPGPEALRPCRELYRGPSDGAAACPGRARTTLACVGDRWSPALRGGGMPPSGGARSCFREEGTPSPLRGSAQPQAFGRHGHRGAAPSAAPSPTTSTRRGAWPPRTTSTRSWGTRPARRRSPRTILWPSSQRRTVG